MTFLWQLLDPETVANLTDSQAAALNSNLEFATASAVLANPELKSQLSDQLKAAAAPMK